MSRVLSGLEPACNTYATSGADGDTPPAYTAPDTNDTTTSNNGSDWVNLYPKGYSKREKAPE